MLTDSKQVHRNKLYGRTSQRVPHCALPAAAAAWHSAGMKQVTTAGSQALP
jgi:hypothetical protein